MGRDFQVDYEVMVRVKGSVQSYIFEPMDLGLCSEGISITPAWKHKDINVDDFGPDVPAEILCMMAEVSISIPLIHYDPDVLNACLSESLGGFQTTTGENDNILIPAPGIMMPAGTPLGGGVELYGSGNHYISLSLCSAISGGSFHFPAAFMTKAPMTLKLGQKTRIAMTTWRAIPYVSFAQNAGPEGISSSGVILWDTDIDLIID